MQAPLYHDRNTLLAALYAVLNDPATYWARHGMRDIVAIVAGYIAQLAISFSILDVGKAILWCDLRNFYYYITFSDGHVEPAGIRGHSARYELNYSEKMDLRVYRYNPVADRWETHDHNIRQLDIGEYCQVTGSAQLKASRFNHELIVPAAASTARFVGLIMFWIDSDGVIRTEPFERPHIPGTTFIRRI